MKKAAKAPAEKSARAKFPTAHFKPEALVSETMKKSDAMKAHPSYANTPEAQQVATSMAASAQSLDDIHAKMGLLHSQLISLETAEARAVAQCYRANEKAAAVVTDLSQGSEEEINKWGFEVRVRNTSPPSNAAPTGLHAVYDKTTLALRLRWKGVRGQRGYLLQIGDGTPNGWGQTIHTGEPVYAPVGLTPGQHVSVRVAVMRKQTQSDWSDALNVLVR